LELNSESKEIQKPISLETNEYILNILTNLELNSESKEIQENFYEQEILNQWKEKYPEWYKENADKIVSHSD